MKLSACPYVTFLHSRTWQDHLSALNIMGINYFHFVCQRGSCVQTETMKRHPGGILRGVKRPLLIITNWELVVRAQGGKWRCQPKRRRSDGFTCEFWIWMVPGGSACVNTCPCDVTMATGWYRVPPEGIICRHEYQVASAATGSHISHYHQSLINFLSAPQTKTRQTRDKMIKFKVR